MDVSGVCLREAGICESEALCDCLTRTAVIRDSEGLVHFGRAVFGLFCFFYSSGANYPFLRRPLTMTRLLRLRLLTEDVSHLHDQGTDRALRLSHPVLVELYAWLYEWIYRGCV